MSELTRLNDLLLRHVGQLTDGLAAYSLACSRYGWFDGGGVDSILVSISQTRSALTLIALELGLEDMLEDMNEDREEDNPPNEEDNDDVDIYYT